MITTADIQKLATLARIKVGDSEAESLAREAEAILGYIAQIQNIAGDSGTEAVKEIPPLRNVMRDDAVTHTPNEYTDGLLANMPSREGRYLKVKKILN